ncbi:DUF4360 domain-containing protein [Actinomadura graeca]|uniref:DUF4360 domain-containing protein n=1 Tax=Actinomadura graeca TaxID=2750812 RepID=A0ABX8QTT9_9ACTN|nr:DUF4360 domain-containing protein [Actinomadura graeca]QXJ22155.1 DUF4360 domain-containing protein [Actinomadura graeca]
MITAVGALGLSVLIASPAPADTTDAPDAAAPENVTIDVASVNGSGCPAGTTTVTNDKSSFTISYSDYLVYAGGDASPTNSRKNCQISLRVRAPGYTYAIRGLEHRGFAGLQADAVGTQRANYYFQGSQENRTITRNIKGRYFGEWRVNDRLENNELLYKPCDEERNLNVNTELRVTPGSDDSKVSFVAADSTHGSETYHFAWRRCN